MPYYPGQPPTDGSQYNYLDDFTAQAQYFANLPPQPPQYYAQAQPLHFQHQQPIQQPVPYYSQSQPVQQRVPQVEIVIPRYSPQQYHQPVPQPQQHAYQPPLANMSSRVLQAVSAPNFPQQQIEAKVEVRVPPQVIGELDYGLLLLTLADEYMETARSLASGSPESFKLIATALGCIESALNNFRLQPLKEAHVSLRYAQILFDETENNDEIEKVLTKAIELCERNRFVDLKYTMQSLLAQALHRSKPRAALKDLQSMIEDAEAYHHVAWEYNFRFLLASLSMGSCRTGQEVHKASSQFEKIYTVANLNGDYAVYAFASIMQALVALQTANLDSIAVAQRSLANARQLQLNPDVAENAQMQVLMEFIDLSCSLQEGSLGHVEMKMKSMQQILYERMDDSSWQEDGAIQLPVSRRSLHGVALQDGGIIIERNGKSYLSFRWLPKAIVEVIGYLLSAASVSHKNAADGGKAEKYLNEGLKLLRSQISAANSTYPSKQRIGSQTLECWFLLDKAYLLCGRGDWHSAKSITEEIFTLTKDMPDVLPAEIICTAKYLEGAIHQATGDLGTALRIFQSPTFSLHQSASNNSAVGKPGRPPSGSPSQQDNTLRRLCLLAAMNIILIVRSPSHPQHHQLPQLLTSIEPLITTTSHKSIQAAYSLVLSTLSESSTTILKTKQHLGNALSVAQLSGNAQVTALTLILMSDKFFKGVIGEQAMKCAKAASHQARRSGDPLWMSVAQGMEAECLEIVGRTEDSRRVREAAMKTTSELPQGILRTRS